MAHPENEVLAHLAEIVSEETGIDTAEIQLDKSFTDDLDIDSLSMMTIVTLAIMVALPYLPLVLDEYPADLRYRRDN